ncbi:tyrosine/serine/threonine protein phosphatase pps1 [Lecanicillium sp. MT-2017a]|nr:tyrosine/serine/threonine protein phosphatase pps1 [Lecanicillium sp. MT-2017a]
MATIALPRPIPAHRTDSTRDVPQTAITPPPSLETPNTTNSPESTAVPNKHIPICPTGPPKSPGELETPPPSPKSGEDHIQQSLLYPPDNYNRIDAGPLAIYEIEPDQVAVALEHASAQALPAPALVFPWLHGLHPLNHMQQTFFTGQRGAVCKPPTCLRGVTLVKADGNLCASRLKGAVAPDEFMKPGMAAEFVEADPADGFSVRNFHIQPAKWALVSDIIVYGDNDTHTRRVAWEIAAAQRQWREKNSIHSTPIAEYNCFVCACPFNEFELHHANLVAIDSAGCATGEVLDLVHQERREMWDMTVASEIAHNVFMGPTPEPGSADEKQFDVLIECSDLGRLNPQALRRVAKSKSVKVDEPFHDFPSSGSILPPTYSHAEADGILETCKWIHHLSHGTYPSEDDAGEDEEGDTDMCSEDGESDAIRLSRKVLLHCADGYTESSMLGIAYYSYSSGKPVADAWLNLHTTKQRNFFAYPSDVALLKAIAPRLLRESPACAGQETQHLMSLVKNEPKWLAGLDGSFPSRILDYLYLGNLGHANNPDLLREVGITQILSVGETAAWREGDLEAWGEDNVCVVQNVQDNGIDPLTDEFQRCLDFIGE